MHVQKNIALIILGFWLLLVGVFFSEVYTYSVFHNVGIIEALETIDLILQKRIISYGAVSFILFVVIYTLRPIVFFPASIMTITSVLVFGPIKGFFISYLGELSSATFTYFIGKYFGEELGITRKKYIWKIAPYFRENAFLSVFVLRIVPIFPFDFVNYASGVFKINFKKYIYATFLGVIPGLIVFIFFTYSLLNREFLPWSIASTILLISIGVWMKQTYEVKETMTEVSNKNNIK